MFSMTKLALAAALVLGAASAAQAGSKDDEGASGGFRVGPLGQEFQGANPAYHRSMRHGGGAYAFVPGYRIPSRHYRTWGWGWDRY
jgi:hypothetical protein